MKEPIRIVHELRRARGTNRKLEILEEHKDNEIWQRVLQYTYDGRISYGVSPPHNVNFDATEIDEGFFLSLDRLANREVTGHQAKVGVMTLSEKYGDIIRLVLGRSLKAGVSVTSINKVMPGLIFQFKTMKGVDTPIPSYPVLASTKYDGVKVFVYVMNEGIQLLTSSGALFRLYALENEFRNSSFGVYEGELVKNLGTQEERSYITGLLNSLLAGNKRDTIKFKYRPYDFLTWTEWENKVGINPFSARYSMLHQNHEQTIGDSAFVFPVEQVNIKTKEAFEVMFDGHISAGYEGLIARYSTDVYEWTGDKRTDRLIKKKAIQEAVLRCIDYTPHSNPNKGYVGSLFCEGFVIDKTYGKVFVTVNVGSGLGKKEIMTPPDMFIGEYIEIMYNSATETEDGYSLFLPRFKRIRK